MPRGFAISSCSLAAESATQTTSFVTVGARHLDEPVHIVLDESSATHGDLRDRIEAGLQLYPMQPDIRVRVVSLRRDDPDAEAQPNVRFDHVGFDSHQGEAWRELQLLESGFDLPAAREAPVSVTSGYSATSGCVAFSGLSSGCPAGTMTSWAQE
ncbi:hypothetical protein [Hyphomicrobium sp.]|uniref:hypothetical protein n=1 Tax=Hyphomicrobium sp. TaxID=82 RepID=UPI002D76D3F4|nr:hypothetical protein [Hyphomicrobium sp.]HET6390711.1 hypothetical protein [Hyphomicrobium sp.]